MVFNKVRDIIVDQLSVDESMVAMDTNLMKDLEADSLDAVEIIRRRTDKIFFPRRSRRFFWLTKAEI